MYNNLLKGNVDECHFLVSTSQEVSLNVNNFKIKNSDWKQLLGVKYDSKLRFDQHITDLCRRANRRMSINQLRERCLKTIYNDKQLPFNDSLEKDGSVSINECNLQVLATEMYKTSNSLSTPLMKDIFPINRNPHERYISNKQKSLYSKTKFSVF